MFQRSPSARPAFLALLLGAAASSGCAPLTFSNEASIDFARYPSVIVEVAGPDGSQRQAEYLESELREHSGFQRVSRAGVFSEDSAPGARVPGAGSSVHLLVELTLDSSYDVSFFDEDDVDVETTYSASVQYRLSSADGALVDSGVDSADDESTSFDAAEAALDRVVLRYLRAYRF